MEEIGGARVTLCDPMRTSALRGVDVLVKEVYTLRRNLEALPKLQGTMDERHGNEGGTDALVTNFREAEAGF